MRTYTSFASSSCVVPAMRSLCETAYGLRTHDVSSGESEPVVLVHGGGPAASRATGRTHIVPALARRFRVYAPDIIGCGDRDKRLMEHSLRTFVKHIAGFIDALTLKARDMQPYPAPAFPGALIALAS